MNIGPVLRAYMLHKEKTIRGLADEIGLDQATLHRMMAGKNPDGKTLAAVVCWLLQDGCEWCGKPLSAHYGKDCTLDFNDDRRFKSATEEPRP